MAEKNLEDLFHDTLKDLYYAERKILTTLPKMVKAAQSPELKAAFEKHRQQTEVHVERLVEVFDIFEQKPAGKTCPAIDGILEEGTRSHGRIQGNRSPRCGHDRALRRPSSITKLPVMAP